MVEKHCFRTSLSKAVCYASIEYISHTRKNYTQWHTSLEKAIKN